MRWLSIHNSSCLLVHPFLFFFKWISICWCCPCWIDTILTLYSSFIYFYLCLVTCVRSRFEPRGRHYFQLRPARITYHLLLDVALCAYANDRCIGCQHELHISQRHVLHREYVKEFISWISGGTTWKTKKKNTMAATMLFSTGFQV